MVIQQKPINKSDFYRFPNITVTSYWKYSETQNIHTQLLVKSSEKSSTTTSHILSTQQQPGAPAGRWHLSAELQLTLWHQWLLVYYISLKPN